MAARFVVIVSLVLACQALPVIFEENEDVPVMVVRVARSPLSFGFGSGMSTSIGGINHATGHGAAFSTGDSEAYGSGFGASRSNGNGFAQNQDSQAFGIGYGASSSNGPGNAYAQGVGYANSAPSLRYQSAAASAQHGPGYNRAHGTAVSHNQNYVPHYQSASASAHGNGHDYQASAAVENRDYNGHNAAIAAAENVGGYQGSSAQAIRQKGSAIQQSGASSINGPGIQAAHSHAINTGYY